MKLQLSRPEGAHRITAYGEAFVAVDGVRHERSLVVMADRILADWDVRSATDLAAGHVARLAEMQPEVVLIGTGTRSRFPPLSALRPLIDAGIGYEIMDTGAACRTFGVLSSEGRRVLAALIIAA
jgi:uncharacterized protein